jgi:hypothetical protein
MGIANIAKIANIANIENHTRACAPGGGLLARSAL